MLTKKSSLAACLSRPQMLDKCQLGSGMQLLEVYLIHERSNEEDAAAGAAQKILGSQGVGQRFRIKPLSLVGDTNDKGFAGIFKRRRNTLLGIIRVAVEHRVDGRLPNCHRNLENFVFVYARLLGHLLGGCLDLIDAVQRGLERISNAACLLSGQMLFLALPHVFLFAKPQTAMFFSRQFACWRRQCQAKSTSPYVDSSNGPQFGAQLAAAGCPVRLLDCIADGRPK